MPGAAPRPPERLGVYVDAPYRIADSPGGEIATVHPADYSLVGVFLAEVGTHFGSVDLFGRVERGGSGGRFVPLPSHLRLVELPDYGDLLQLRRVLGATAGTIARFWKRLPGLDVVLVFGPHPIGLLLAALALARGRRVVLGVRQETSAYFRARLPSRRWLPVLAVVRVLDSGFRLLARRAPTLVAGTEIARRYGGESPRVLVMADSVVRASDVAAEPPARDWSGTIELLTVGRVDPEKNPLLLVDTLAELDRGAPGRFRLTWVGGGSLEDSVRARARELGVDGRVTLRGWLPFGPEVLDLYRQAHVFLHVSLTEGVPRVLVEALACGAAVVATDVGGVANALDGGRAGLLVPPGDRAALAGAVRRLVEDAELRERRVARGHELARERTLEMQAARVAGFILGRPVDARLRPADEPSG